MAGNPSSVAKLIAMMTSNRHSDSLLQGHMAAVYQDLLCMHFLVFCEAVRGSQLQL